ncbi:MAG: hypothetical protein MI755_04815 [Sphingomonadales bacterium]|nr:hypothetical protein [Sphingomonadales bacterium]
MAGSEDLFGPKKISKKDVLRLAEVEPRRISFAYTRTDQPKRKSGYKGSVGTFSVPFRASVGDIFERDTHLHLSDKGQFGGYGRYIESESEFAQIKDWVKRQGTRIFLRDCLDLSIALDLNRPRPGAEYSALGRLEHQAKHTHKENPRAIRNLVTAYCEAITDLPFYRECEIIAAVPAHPDKHFDLPRILAQRIAEELGIQDVTHRFSFSGPKREIKDAPASERWDVWDECGLSFDPPLEDSPSVILIDDKYQSGVTIHYVASKLRDAGVGEIYGLCAVKTLRDTDNQ